MIKLYWKYVEFLDTSFKKLFEEIKAIGAMIPKPKPRPPKQPKSTISTNAFGYGVGKSVSQRPAPTPPPPPPRPSILSTPTTMKVSVERVKKNLDYMEDIRKEVDHYNKSYVNDSVPLTATKMFNQPISGTYKPTVLSASIDDYLKMMYKNPVLCNVKRRANKILDEIDENIEPKPSIGRKGGKK